MDKRLNELKNLNSEQRTILQSIVGSITVKFHTLKINILIISMVMFFFCLVIFFTEYLPFNEETVVIFCVFFAFLCIDSFASNLFKDYFTEHINDIISLADKKMAEVKAILSVKNRQEKKCNSSLTDRKILIYSLFIKIFNIADFFPVVVEIVLDEENSKE